MQISPISPKLYGIGALIPWRHEGTFWVVVSSLINRWCFWTYVCVDEQYSLIKLKTGKKHASKKSLLYSLFSPLQLKKATQKNALVARRAESTCDPSAHPLGLLLSHSWLTCTMVLRAVSLKQSGCSSLACAGTLSSACWQDGSWQAGQRAGFVGWGDSLHIGQTPSSLHTAWMRRDCEGQERVRRVLGAWRMQDINFGIHVKLGKKTLLTKREMIVNSGVILCMCVMCDYIFIIKKGSIITIS